MKIDIHTSKIKKRRRDKIRDFLLGAGTGVILFGLLGSRVLWHGIEAVETYTWIALGFGVLSFGFIGMWFGSSFWRQLIDY